MRRLKQVLCASLLLLGAGCGSKEGKRDAGTGGIDGDGGVDADTPGDRDAGTRADATGRDAEDGACTPVAVAPPAGSPATPARYFPPTRFMLGPIYGTGCPRWGQCESGGSTTDEVNYHLDKLAENDIPITMYHFDGQAWSATEMCDWTLGDTLKARLADRGYRALMHIWAGCWSTDDFEHVYGQLGATLGGFYLDEYATDDFAQQTIDWVQSKMPGDGEVVMKAFAAWEPRQTNEGIAAYGHSCFVADLDADFEGLKEGIRRVLTMSKLLPAPYNEFTAYDIYDGRTDEETFFRRIHFGAMQVVMDHSPQQNASPWNTGLYSRKLLDDYVYFAWLHKELVPYLFSYDWNAYETGEPIFRDPDPEAFTTKLGDQIFVAYVTRYLDPPTQFEIKLPAGEWIDYWNPRGDVVTGTLTGPLPVLGREPIFIANGAIIPMDVSRPITGHGTAASAGSLTVLVYPKGDSSFRYRDDTAKRWIAIEARQSGESLTLATSAGLSQPILYRVERRPAPPARVSICGTTVTVNGGGAGIPPAASETDVNGAATPAWFYDAAEQRLIVKAFP